MATEVGIRFIGEDVGILNSIDEQIKKAVELAFAEERLNKSRKKGAEDNVKGNELVNNSLNDTIKQTNSVIKQQQEYEAAAKKSLSTFKLFGVSLKDVTDKSKDFVSSLKGSLSILRQQIKVTDDQKDSIKDLSRQFGINRKLSTGVAQGARLISFAMKAIPIFALIAGFTALISFFTSTQRGANLLSKGFGVLSATTEVIRDRINDVGESFFNVGKSIVNFGKSLFTLDFIGIGDAANDVFSSIGDSVDAVTDSTNGLGEALVNAASAASLLADDKVKLRLAEIELTKSFKETRAEIKRLNKDSEDLTLPFAVRQKAAQDAFNLEKGLLEKRIELGQKNLDVVQRTVDLESDKDNIDGIEKIAEAEGRLSDIKLESFELQTTINNKLNAINKERQAKIDAERARVAELRQAYQDLNVTLAEDLLELDLEQSDPVTRLNKQREIALSSLNDQKNLLIEAANAVGEPIDSLEASFDRLISATVEKFSRERVSLDISDIVAFDKDIKLKDGTKLVAPLLEIEPRDLNINPQKITFEEDSFRDAFLDVFDSIKDVFQDEDFQQFLSGFNTAFNEFASLFTQGIDNQIADIDRLSEKRQEDISALEEELETKADLEEKGYQFNVDGKAEELEQLRAQEEADQAKKAELQAKAQRVQLIQDSISQGSALATSGANIIRGFTAAFPVIGPGLGIAAVIAMFASFAKLKIDAFNATRLYTGADSLWEGIGAIAPGEASDIPGRGDGLSIVDSNGNLRARVGGDEMLWDEDISRSHGVVGKWIKKNANHLSSKDMLELLQGGVMPSVASAGRSLSVGVSRSDVAERTAQAKLYAGLTDASLIRQNQDLIRRMEVLENKKPKYVELGGGRRLEVTRS